MKRNYDRTTFTLIVVLTVFLVSSFILNANEIGFENIMEALRIIYSQLIYKLSDDRIASRADHHAECPLY